MRKKTFTLIETLLVIAVFGTGILAVVYGISQTLRMQYEADMMVQSSFLAREGIELMYQLRDANYAKKLPWNCLFIPKPQYNQEIPFCPSFFT